MGLERTDAIVLRGLPFGDTSRIIRCYTADFGKLSIIAKGVRSSKMLTTAYLEPLSHISLTFYHSPKRNLQLFSRAEFLHLWPGIRSDVKKLAYGFVLAELVDRAVTGTEPNPGIHETVVAFLEAMDRRSAPLAPLFWNAQLRLLLLLGFHPTFDVCGACGRGMDRGLLVGPRGELLCPVCGERTERTRNGRLKEMAWNSDGEAELSPESLSFLNDLSKQDAHDVPESAPSRRQRREIGTFLRLYWRYHVEGAEELRSLKVMREILSLSSPEPPANG